MRWIIVVFLSCFFIGSWAQSDARSNERKLLEDLLDSSKYDRQFRPYGTTNKTNPWGGPVKVTVQVFVRDIYKLNDNKEELTTQLTFRQQWRDDRLVYEDRTEAQGVKFLRLQTTDRIWFPDLFFANEIESDKHDVFSDNDLLRIYPDGTVMYSTRVTVRLRCPMDFKMFPFDGQRCNIIFPTYGYTTEDLVLSWKHTDPVQVSKNIHPQRFTLEQYRAGHCDAHTATGRYSCLKVGLLFKREFGYYQIQVYIPSAMMVIVSWLTFWLDRKKVTARLILALFSLITMSTQVAYLNAFIPVANYTKAIDVWTGTCLTFLFGALIEFIIVLFLSRRQKPNRTNENDIPLNNIEGEEKLEKQEEPSPIKRTRFCCNIWPLVSTPDGLDLVSRLVYPLVFILFNIIYWTAYAFAFGYAESAFNDSMGDNNHLHSHHQHSHTG